jgi:homoserine kinase type II
MNCSNESDVRKSIFEALEDKFKVNILSFASIDLGYLNLKWKITTDIGDFFVKQYNKKRYPNNRINELEISLKHQGRLYQLGIPCPKLYLHNEKYVSTTTDGTNFVLMGLCEGKNIMPGTANEKQVKSLGKVISRMHKLLNETNTTKPPLHWRPNTKENMLRGLQDRRNEAINFKCPKTIEILETQRRIIESTNLEIFSECEQGWCHWDLFSDNILFNAGNVSAILDFDRMHYVYQEFDISRPILSCCLEEGSMNLQKVLKFVEGYREYKPLTRKQLVRSIKLTWWKESDWVRVEEKQKASLKRFSEENIWIAENWNELDRLFADI